jgi:hypothetical protein
MFCSDCGVKLVTTAKFCSACGAAVSKSEIKKDIQERVVNKELRNPENQRDSGKIEIAMESQPFLLKLGKIQVLLDGKVISSDLWFGKTIEFSIEDSKEHRLQIQLKSVLTRSSEELIFQVRSGQKLKFEGVYSNFSGGVSLVQM